MSLSASRFSTFTEARFPSMWKPDNTIEQDDGLDVMKTMIPPAIQRLVTALPTLLPVLDVGPKPVSIQQPTINCTVFSRVSSLMITIAKILILQR